MRGRFRIRMGQLGTRQLVGSRCDAIQRAAGGIPEEKRLDPGEGRKRGAGPGSGKNRPVRSYILPTIASRRAMRFSIGGWVEKSLAMPPPPPNGLAIIMCAVVGWAVAIGMRWV